MTYESKVLRRCSCLACVPSSDADPGTRVAYSAYSNGKTVSAPEPLAVAEPVAIGVDCAAHAGDRLQRSLEAITAARLRCIQGSSVVLEDIAAQIKLRTEILIRLGTLRDQMMRDRFGSEKSEHASEGAKRKYFH
jgi:hypothetical protein